MMKNRSRVWLPVRVRLYSKRSVLNPNFGQISTDKCRGILESLGQIVFSGEKPEMALWEADRLSTPSRKVDRTALKRFRRSSQNGRIARAFTPVRFQLEIDQA